MFRELFDNGFIDYNDNPIPDTIIDTAEQFFNELFVMPFVTVTGRRTIQFELDCKDNTHIEIEFFEDRISFLIIPNKDMSLIKEVSFTNYRELVDIVNEEYRKRDI